MYNFKKIDNLIFATFVVVFIVGLFWIGFVGACQIKSMKSYSNGEYDNPTVHTRVDNIEVRAYTPQGEQITNGYVTLTIDGQVYEYAIDE